MVSKKGDNPTGTVPLRPEAGPAAKAQAILDRFSLQAVSASAELSNLLWKMDLELREAKKDAAYWHAQYEALKKEVGK